MSELTLISEWGVYNIPIYQGSDLYIRFSCLNEDESPYVLNGFNARGYMRYKHSDTDFVLDLQPSITYPELGYIDINIPASGITNISPTRYLYDIEIYNDSVTERILMGFATIDPEETF